MVTRKISRGTTYTIEVNFKRNGVPATLVGATVRFTAKTKEWDEDLDDSDAILLKNVTTGDVNGHAEIVLIPSDTATKIPNKYNYDIKVQLPSGEVFKIDEGKIELDGSPTNRLS